ncbi:MAG: leucine--tRNA ligase, partial [Planctomycetota bacterium]
IPGEIESEGAEAVRRYQDGHRLAYQHEAPVNWCPALGTVLANEEVIDGKSERGGHPVERLPLRQWMLRITAYADRLLDGLEGLDWPESVKALQRNWIGRSTGAEVDFELVGRDEALRVYTTRPDTLYGATYMVVAPEHPLVDSLVTDETRDAVEAYRRDAAFKSDLDRTELSKEKTGVFSGSHAVNPLTGQPVPVWVADYVLMGYGTGAIMAVPAHDTRDWEFATAFGLPIVPVVDPPGNWKPSKDEQKLGREIDGVTRYPFTGAGTAINSGEFDGTPTAEFKIAVIKKLTDKGVGSEAVNYKLRDWLFSRQHFWGEPFPLWHEIDADGNLTGLVRVEENLPVDLPKDFDFKPHGRPEPPLDEAPAGWLYKTAEDGTHLKRETNSMPQWAGSCWYYLRFVDPRNGDRFVGEEAEKHWLPVDLYIGGAEHAV